MSAPAKIVKSTGKAAKELPGEFVKPFKGLNVNPTSDKFHIRDFGKAAFSGLNALNPVGQVVTASKAFETAGEKEVAKTKEAEKQKLAAEEAKAEEKLSQEEKEKRKKLREQQIAQSVGSPGRPILTGREGSSLFG